MVPSCTPRCYDRGIVKRLAWLKPHLQRRMRRWAVAGAIGLILIASVVAFVATSLVRTAPAWWRTVDVSSPTTVSRAETLENAVVTQLYLHRDEPGQAEPKPWRVAISASDANAWLNVRLRSWLASQGDLPQWPEALADFQVDFDEGLVRVGARVQAESGHQVVSADIRPALDTGGAVWTPAEWVHLGRLPVPGPWALDRATSPAAGYVPDGFRGTPEAELLLAALRGAAALGEDAVIALGDGRQVRLLDIRARGGRLELTCLTERADSGPMTRR